MNLVNGQVLTALLMSSLFAAMVAVATQFPADARLLPLFIGIPGTILCLIQLYFEVKGSFKNAPSIDKAEIIKEIRFFLWFPAFVASILLFGFIPTTIILVFLFLRLDQREPLKLSLGLSLGGALVLYLLFELVLGLPLFLGFIHGWIMG